MKKTTRNIILGSGALAVGATAATRATSSYLAKLAMDREIPKNLQKKRQILKGNQDLIDFIDEMGAASERLENSPHEEVEITGHDGIRLVGHWVTCEDPKRVIIAMHGWRSSWSRDFGIIADFWHNNGRNVLYAEQRGQNNSGGDHMGFGMLERYDCLDWIHWVNEYTGGELPVYLGGASMGATTVLMAAGLELPDNVHGIMADCGFTSPYAIWKHVMKNNLHMPYGIYSAAVNDLCKKKIRMGARDCSAVDALRSCRVPVLFVHGADDRFVPVEMTYENYKACAAPKRLLVVPGADHGMSYFVNQEGYEVCLQDFWRDFDNK